MMRLFQKANGFLDGIAMVGVVLFFFYLFGEVLFLLSPITTVIGVALLTGLAFDRWTTAALAVAGITLYIASWFTLEAWNAFSTVLLCSLGFLTWFAAVHRSFSNRFLATKIIIT